MSIVPDYLVEEDNSAHDFKAGKNTKYHRHFGNYILIVYSANIFSMKFLFPIFIVTVSVFLLTSRVNAEVGRTGGQTANTNTSVCLNVNNSSKIRTSSATKDFENGAVSAQTKQPKTVRDFFNLLPQKYFTLERCVDKPTKNNCDKARAEYLKNYLEVEDTANGYMKGSCDGAQSCFTMVLFKRPNGTYIIAINKLFETSEQTHFLEYTSGKWKDIGAQVIPGYGKEKTYELPRQGTTTAVYQLKETDEGFIERGEKLYELVWRNGKFSIKK